MLDTVSDADADPGSMPAGTFRGLDGGPVDVDLLDVLVTGFSDRKGFAIAAINKDPIRNQSFDLALDYSGEAEISTLNGESTESYNDIGRDEITVKTKKLGKFAGSMSFTLEPHSVNIITLT